MNVQLIPVLEVQLPQDAFNRVVPRPQGDFRTHTDEWEAYQKELLKASGYADYHRVIKGKNFVSVNQWRLPDLFLLIRRHLGEDDPLPITQSCALFGGCVLIVDDVPVLGPQCCGTIADFYSWETLIHPQFVTGYFCHEGHPNPMATRNENVVIIECQDEEETFTQPAVSKITVELSLFSTAIRSAQLDLKQLSANLNLLSADFGVEKLSHYLIQE